jgi:hypothetical protein
LKIKCCFVCVFRGWLVGWWVVGQDLHHTMFLPTAYREQLRSALEADTQFLALHNIMDYSLLLGIVVRTSHAHCLSIFTLRLSVPSLSWQIIASDGEITVCFALLSLYVQEHQTWQHSATRQLPQHAGGGGGGR